VNGEREKGKGKKEKMGAWIMHEKEMTTIKKNRQW
jgi:hypothetical protein